MLTSLTQKDARPGYRPFEAEVSKITRLSEHFVRVTFTGAELSTFGTDGLDQRVKLVIPFENGVVGDFGYADPETISAGDWYARWRELPEEGRNPFRTYTVRAVRPERAELDIDMVAHADGGPAARWLSTAAVGDRLVVVGPDEQSLDSHIGIDWHPGGAKRMLLAGDETAAPAICSIVESLPAGVQAHAFIEVPDSADAQPVRSDADVRLSWLSRGARAHGALLAPAVRGWLLENRAVYGCSVSAAAQPLDDIDVDTQMLWDSFGESGGDFYAWLAGESAVIKDLRRALVSEAGIDRKQVSFMGYWRLGRAEAQ